MYPLIHAIEDRIFSVELYSGITEKVEQITDGAPAPLNTSVHLLQRRHYMDEECLANYEAGGMQFKDIRGFNKWLAKPEQRDRLLPFSRCIVAFRVRRLEKEPDETPFSIADYVKIEAEKKQDATTYLYIRNGDQLWFLRTAIDFGETLFPDLEDNDLANRTFAEMTDNGHKIEKFITANEHAQIVEEHEKAMREYNQKKHEWYDSKPRLEKYEKFDHSSVYYDDISKVIGRHIQAHNSIALLIQGLLDRSPILHPHPAWQLWTQEGFTTGLTLVYDQTRALTVGDAPDFEAYRARLNASLKTGSITVGQDAAWVRRETAKEHARIRADYRTRADLKYYPKQVRPYKDLGPGMLAKVEYFKANSQQCVYKWQRNSRRDAGGWARMEYGDKGVMDTLTVAAAQVLNVSAYTPGDYHIFFDDPRTRAQYLQWAPLLLEAEEYYAGNREVHDKNTPIKDD